MSLNSQPTKDPDSGEGSNSGSARRTVTLGTKSTGSEDSQTGHAHAGHPHCGHHHGLHSHVDPNFKLNRSFALAVVLNVLLVIGEAIAAYMSGSMALLADAGHNLSDVAGLIIAWWAHWIRGKGTGDRWTYGFRGFTILAANMNGIMIVAAILGVSIESVRRLLAPTEVSEVPVLVVALLAAGLNFVTAKLLSGGSHDLNVRGAYLHMLADAAVSLAVVIGALVMMFTDWRWIDPAISLGICLVLALGTWRLLKESTSLLLNAVPEDIDVPEIRNFLLDNPMVSGVDDLHVWSVSTTDTLLTARICCPRTSADEQDQLLKTLRFGLNQEFGIKHSTLEIVRQCEDSYLCSLSRDD